MSAKPVAGTFRLDGMLQGPLPADAAVAGDMEAWVAAARKSGLIFHLAVEGASFSMVADPAVQKTSRLGRRELGDLLEESLDGFLDLLPAGSRPAAFSTVRSEEFRPGTAVQTLFAVGPDGQVSGEQREVDVETEAPPPELTAASLRRAAIPLLLVVLIGLVASSFFIDYRKLFSEARDRVVPLTKEEVAIRQEALAGVVEVELTGVDNNRNMLVFEIRRGSGWDGAVASSPVGSTADWRTFLMHAAVHRGRLRAEMFNKEGELLGDGEISLNALREKESAEVAIVARLRDRLTSVVVRP